jgi:hypothetical protein
MLVTLSGIVTEVREVQYPNELFPIAVTVLGAPNVTEVREAQLQKAFCPMDVTPLGMVREVRERQASNELFPILMTLPGIATEVRTTHPPNAKSAMEVTLPGIVTDVMLWLLLNAFSPIVMVAYPPNAEGIVIAPPAPVYPVMVACPSLTE